MPPARQLPWTWAMTGMVQSRPGPSGPEVEHRLHVALEAGLGGGVGRLDVVRQDPVPRGEGAAGAPDHDGPVS